MSKKVIISGFAIQGMGLLLLVIYLLLDWINELTILAVLGFFSVGAVVNTVGIIIFIIEKHRALHDKYSKDD